MKKHFVCKLNSKGFLLLEHLIALIITSLLLITLLSLIQVTKLYASNTDAVLLNELEALATQIQIEARLSLYFSSPNHQILNLHQSNGDTISYFISDERLMRQVNGKGGEIALYHCKTLNVKDHQANYATIHLKTSSQSMTIYLNTFNLPLPTIELLEDEELLEELDDLSFPLEENNNHSLLDKEFSEDSLDVPFPNEEFFEERDDDLIVEDEMINEELMSDD